MDTTRWKSVAIRRDIVDIADEIGKKTERPTSNVFAFAVKQLQADLNDLQQESEDGDKSKFELEKIPTINNLKRKKYLFF